MSEIDLNYAFNVLEKLTNQVPQHDVAKKTIVSALKAIHHAVLTGTSEQKNRCLTYRKEIVQLNQCLAKGTLPHSIKTTFDENQPDDALDGLQVAIPLTSFENMLHTASLIPQAIISLLSDLLLLPIGGALTLHHMLSNPTLDPPKPSQDKTPILLLHGSGSNESTWLLGRYFLKKENYGSVFSLNYDGLLSNDPKKGIDDYAQNKVRQKILEIQQKTGQDRVILIGHSMGGLIAGFYAEHLADLDQIQVDHIISIASPWQGSPIIDRYMLGENTSKRYRQMCTDSTFRKNLVEKIRQAERKGKRKYYSIGSHTDCLVPGMRGLVTEDPRRQRLYQSLGHCSVIASPFAWKQITTWLDKAYREESSEYQIEKQLQKVYGNKVFQIGNRSIQTKQLIPAIAQHLANLGLFHWQKKLGQGAYGSVYKIARKNGKSIALKLFYTPPSLSDDQGNLDGDAIALQLPAKSHLCRVRGCLTCDEKGVVHYLDRYDSAQHTKHVLLATLSHFVEGNTLAEETKNRSFSVNEALEYGKELAQAIRSLHNAGFVHKDVHKENILIKPPKNGKKHRVKLLDFGMAQPATTQMQLYDWTRLKNMLNIMHPDINSTEFYQNLG